MILPGDDYLFGGLRPRVQHTLFTRISATAELARKLRGWGEK